VIDASIMGAAGGEDALDPISTLCRDFLDAMIGLKHTVIVTDDIEKEWEDHSSSFSRNWYFRMRKRNQVKRHRGNAENLDLRQAIFGVLPEDVHAVVTKDMHLIEAAQLADERIASKDDKVRGHFQRAAAKVEALQPIIWVNPANKAENCIAWLKENAPADDHRRLGYTPPEKND
jgi:hypothetical protein